MLTFPIALGRRHERNKKKWHGTFLRGADDHFMRPSTELQYEIQYDKDDTGSSRIQGSDELMFHLPFQMKFLFCPQILQAVNLIQSNIKAYNKNNNINIWFPKGNHFQFCQLFIFLHLFHISKIYMYIYSYCLVSFLNVQHLLLYILTCYHHLIYSLITLNFFMYFFSYREQPFLFFNAFLITVSSTKLSDRGVFYFY